MKKFAVYSIPMLIAASAGLWWSSYGSLSEFVDIHIAGDYHMLATSDDYQEIYSEKTDFGIRISGSLV